MCHDQRDGAGCCPKEVVEQVLGASGLLKDWCVCECSHIGFFEMHLSSRFSASISRVACAPCPIANSPIKSGLLLGSRLGLRCSRASS